MVNCNQLMATWINILITFTEPRHMPEDVANVGERLLLKLCKSSDRHRWINFVSPCTLDRLVGHLLTLSSGFNFESFPPTVATVHSYCFNKRFNKIATRGPPQMAVDKEANSLSRVYSYYSKFTLCLFYV